MLLYDAISRLANAPIGVHALCANAIDEGAVAFYQAHQFTRFALRINARMHAKGGEAL